MVKRDESKVRRTQPEERVLVRHWTGTYLTMRRGSAFYTPNPKEGRVFANASAARVFINTMGFEGEPVQALPLVA